MKFLGAIYKTILDALFPLSKAEEEILLLTPEKALAKLPAALAYDASVVPLKSVKSVFAYKDERVSKLVWSIKYKKSVHSVQIGGYALYKALPQDSRAAIVPIPITSRRRRERGFNQCELLLDEIQRLDSEKRFIFEKDLLQRVRHASHQTLKSRDERLRSSKGIFSVNEEIVKQIKGATLNSDHLIIVIDDVITTGSTMKEALDVLRSSGFSNVAGLSLAH